jgi:thioredoxin-like negative regulator of GroEL
MVKSAQDARAAVAAAVKEYRNSGDIARLLAALDAVCMATPSTVELIAAVEPYRELHEVAGPVYERVVEREPENAQALVALANAYWLTGRGPDAVGEIAGRALASDPENRAAWHLWALTESSPRGRMTRWQQVTQRFPDDKLAHAALADNATSVAGAENDPVALKLAIGTYEMLMATASDTREKEALSSALTTLRNWKS